MPTEKTFISPCKPQKGTVHGHREAAKALAVTFSSAVQTEDGWNGTNVPPTVRRHTNQRQGCPQPEACQVHGARLGSSCCLLPVGLPSQHPGRRGPHLPWACVSPPPFPVTYFLSDWQVSLPVHSKSQPCPTILLTSHSGFILPSGALGMVVLWIPIKGVSTVCFGWPPLLP